MKLKPYPKYKDSGVPWLGDVPEGWGIKRLRFVSKINPSKQEITIGHNDLVSFCPMESISEKGALDLNIEKPLNELLNGYTYFAEGDVIFAKITPCFENGKSAIARNLLNGYAFGTTELHVLRANKEIDENFLYHLISSYLFRKMGESEMYGAGGQKRVPEAFVKDFFIGIPSYREQQTITHFLDIKTAKIDALIAKKEKLLELLTEKRQAFITQAVTKGLNPNVKMKDSGVPWLGEIPMHWSKTKLKRIVAIPITDGPHETPNFISAGIPFISAESVSTGVIDFSKMRGFISEKDNEIYSKKYAPKVYDIYMIKSGATTGVTAIVENENVFNIWSPLAVIRCKKYIEPYYILNLMRSRNFQESIILHWSYGTQQNIGMDVIGNLFVLAPPPDEQKKIVEKVVKDIQLINKLIIKIKKSITNIIEYRSSLITNIVSGKVYPEM